MDPRRLPPVDVEAASGGRADERPAKVHLEGRWVAVRRVLETELVEDSHRRRWRRFRVLLEDGLVLGLVRDDTEGAWYRTPPA